MTAPENSWDNYHLVLYLLFFLKDALKISSSCRLDQRQDKDLELQSQALIGKRKLIGNIDNITSYVILHDSANVLGTRLLNTNISEGLHLIDQKTKDNACWYLKVMHKGVNLALYTRVVVQVIAVKVVKLRDVLLQSKALEGCGHVRFHKNSFSEDPEALEILDEQYYVFVVNVFTNRHYFALTICLIKMEVKIVESHQILSFGSL